MAGNIEFTIGQESHSSNWGKYYVKGLEQWQVKENGSYDKHQSYTEYQCNDVPDGTVFTIFEQSGDKRGTELYFFTICVVDAAGIESDEGGYAQGRAVGNYKVLAKGEGKVKAPRLMDWWVNQRPAGVDPVAFALHCAEHINRRGVKDVPAMPQTQAQPVAVPPAIPVDVMDLIGKYGKDNLIELISSHGC